MSTITLYGIKNCDTVKKARKWLEEQGIDITLIGKFGWGTYKNGNKRGLGMGMMMGNN